MSSLTELVALREKLKISINYYRKLRTELTDKQQRVTDKHERQVITDQIILINSFLGTLERLLGV